MSYKFNCLCCGTCCAKYQPRLEKSEVVSISGHLGMTEAEFIAEFTDPKWPGEFSYLIKHNESGCLFLTRSSDGVKRLCRIHNVKPDCCSKWEAGLNNPECRTGLQQIWNLSSDENGLISGAEEDVNLFLSANNYLR